MYKIIFFSVAWLNVVTSVQAQTDSIYTLNKVIAGTVLELGINEVRYLKPGNNTMNVILQKCAVQKIKFANGEEMIIDSTLVLKPFINDSILQPVLLTHFEDETHGLNLICEKDVQVPSNYYFNTFSRPKQNKYLAVIKDANVMGAELVYLQEDVQIMNEAAIYEAKIYAVKAKFYTVALRDYSMIINMVSINKDYLCKVFSADEKADTIETGIKIKSINVYNNFCTAKAKLIDELGDELVDMRIIYFDGDKFIGEYVSNENNERKKLIFNFIQTPRLIGPSQKVPIGKVSTYNFNAD
jgi:hypothetical protein